MLKKGANSTHEGDGNLKLHGGMELTARDIAGG
jgi:hypothetical protein